MTQLCDKCKGALLSLPIGPGECIEICRDCDIRAATDYLQKGRGDGWIDVRCMLPEQYDEVLISDGKIVTSSYFQDGSFVGRETAIEVTHWMAMPKPPNDRQ
jgi:hypothetical protein